MLPVRSGVWSFRMPVHTLGQLRIVSYSDVLYFTRIGRIFRLLEHLCRMVTFYIALFVIFKDRKIFRWFWRDFERMWNKFLKILVTLRNPEKILEKILGYFEEILEMLRPNVWNIMIKIRENIREILEHLLRHCVKLSSIKEPKINLSDPSFEFFLSQKWNVLNRFLENFQIRTLHNVIFCIFRLSQGKQNKIYLPEEPFPHAHLLKNGRLKQFKHIYDDGFCNDMRQVNLDWFIAILPLKFQRAEILFMS